MKKFILLFTLIYFSFCTTEQCAEEKDQEKCNSIKVDEEGLFCFKADYEDNDYEDIEDYEEEDACLPFPINPDYQKLHFKFVNGIIKEYYSSMGSLLGDSEFYDAFESSLFKSDKETYTTSETIKISSGKLSNVDKTIIKSEQTCSYYLYGRYYKSVVLLLEEGNKDVNSKYEDITDKNICYNARKFNDFKNLIDCGHAEIKLKLDGDDYTIQSCYPIPTANLPALYAKEYTNYQKEYIVEGMLKSILYAMAGKDIDEIEDDSGRRRRRLESGFSYDISVENKYGRKITFSSKNENSYTIDAEGVPGPVEELETESGNKSGFIGINFILLILLSLF